MHAATSKLRIAPRFKPVVAVVACQRALKTVQNHEPRPRRKLKQATPFVRRNRLLHPC